MRIFSAFVVLASLGGLALGRQGGRGGNFSLEEARAFREFPLYYAGDEVDDLPLTAVLRRAGSANYVSFVYGDCTPSSDGGCAPPAEVQVWPGGTRSASSYDGLAPGAPAPERTKIRGHPAASLDDGNQLEIYADGSTIVVFSGTRERALGIARALRCVRPTGHGPVMGRLQC